MIDLSEESLEENLQTVQRTSSVSAIDMHLEIELGVQVGKRMGGQHGH